MSFADWSTTAASNTTVGGVSIAEGCPASNLNNAERQIMAELRAAIAPALDAFLASTTLSAALTALGALAAVGGEVTGNIVRHSAGPHLYHTNAAFGSGRVFYTAAGASDPTSLAGDIWIIAS